MRRAKAFFEHLESRSLMSATLDSVVATPSITAIAAASSSTTAGITPALIKAAYGIDDISFGSTSGTGAGQTIAIVDAYNDPNIAADLATFSSAYNLSTASLSVVSQTGSTTKLPTTDTDWAAEISLDVEWAHAVAPSAKILLVEANSASMSDLLAAVKYASSVSSVSVVSMSWGTSEFSSELSYNSYFTTPSGHQGITYVASSGDSSAVEWPAISTNVLSVGGTTLSLSSSGTTTSETAWSYSGGGSSRYLAEANYATSIQSTGHSTSPDVSYDANPNTGFAVYDSLADDGVSGWQTVGGTSAGAPQWAALVAIADQGRAINGLATLDGATGTLPTLYSLAADSATYTENFTDITSGGTRSASTSAGYDLVTGLGTPKAASLVSALSTSTTTSSGSVTSTGALVSTITTRRPPRGNRGGGFRRNSVTVDAGKSPTPSARTVADVARASASQVLTNAIAVASGTFSDNVFATRLVVAGGDATARQLNSDITQQTKFAPFSAYKIADRDTDLLAERVTDDGILSTVATSSLENHSDDASEFNSPKVDLIVASHTATAARKTRESSDDDSTTLVTAAVTSIALGVYLAHVQRRKQSARDNEA